MCFSRNKAVQGLLLGVLFSAAMPLFAQVETGKASYYSDRWKGRRTSSGERYNPDSLTCAHKTHPFGTYLKVTNVKNDLSTIVKVTDRGPFVRGRVVDLSGKAARDIQMIQAGIAEVRVEPMPMGWWPGQVSAVPDTLPHRYIDSALPRRRVIVCDERGFCWVREPDGQIAAIDPMDAEEIDNRRRKRRR